MKKVGFFGGTFDPIHFGHLNLAIHLMEIHHLEQVLFCPASTSPFKSETPPHSSKKDRLEMVRLAVLPVAAFQVLDLQLAKEGPSYTIDTIKELQKLDPEVDLHLILGGDMIELFDQWKDFEELIDLATPLIGTRLSEPCFSHLPHEVAQVLKAGVTRIPMMDVSSTEIRERLKHKKYCGHLAPASVLKYVEQNRLYS